MKVGDLVEVMAKDIKGISEPIHLGILMGYDTINEGWKVMTESRVETFAIVWWHVQKVKDKIG